MLCVLIAYLFNILTEKPKPMTQNFTDYDIIQFLYGELNHEKNQMLRKQSANDLELKERLHAFRQVHDQLEEVHHKPSQTSINLILKYSRNKEALTPTF